LLVWLSLVCGRWAVLGVFEVYVGGCVSVVVGVFVVVVACVMVLLLLFGRCP
jgi:hypothetical protein